MRLIFFFGLLYNEMISSSCLDFQRHELESTYLNGFDKSLFQLMFGCCVISFTSRLNYLIHFDLNVKRFPDILNHNLLNVLHIFLLHILRLGGYWIIKQKYKNTDRWFSFECYITSKY